MNERQRETIERFRNAFGFFAGNPIPHAPPLVSDMCGQLRKSLARIEQADRVQNHHPVAGRGRVPERRDSLRRTKLIPLRRIALPLMKNIPGARAALSVPATHASAATVAAAAVRMVDYLLPKSGLLRSAGVTKDFLRDLKAEARALALSTRERETWLARRSEATRIIRAEITKGLGAISTLDGLVALHAPEQLDGFRGVSGIHARVGRPRKVKRRRPREGSRTGPAAFD